MPSEFDNSVWERMLAEVRAADPPPAPPAKPSFWDKLKQTNTAKFAKGVADSAVSAATLPGDVYAGRVDPTSDTGIQRAMDMTGALSLSGLTRAAGPLAENAIELGIFAGRNAKTADLAKLSLAEAMLANGLDKEYIRRETGWFPNDRGDWKFEISDQDAIVRSHFYGKPVDFEGTLGDYLHHPKLFEAYPDMENMPFKAFKQEVRDDGSIGYYMNAGLDKDKVWQPEEMVVMGSGDDPEGVLKTVLHESMHGVQDREGFQHGTSLQASGGSKAKYNESPGEIEARDVEARRKMSDKQRQQWEPASIAAERERRLIDDMKAAGLDPEGVPPDMDVGEWWLDPTQSMEAQKFFERLRAESRGPPRDVDYGERHPLEDMLGAREGFSGGYYGGYRPAANENAWQTRSPDFASRWQQKDLLAKLIGESAEGQPPDPKRLQHFFKDKEKAKETIDKGFVSPLWAQFQDENPDLFRSVSQDWPNIPAFERIDPKYAPHNLTDRPDFVDSSNINVDPALDPERARAFFEKLRAGAKGAKKPKPLPPIKLSKDEVLS